MCGVLGVIRGVCGITGVIRGVCGVTGVIRECVVLQVLLGSVWCYRCY